MHEINYISKVKQYCERKGRKFLLLFVLDKVLWVILNNSETFPFSDKRLMECILMQKLTAANGWLRAASLMLLKGDSNITPCGSSPVV